MNALKQISKGLILTIVKSPKLLYIFSLLLYYSKNYFLNNLDVGKKNR